MKQTGLHHRLKGLAGRGLKTAYRKLLAGRYGGHVSGKSKHGAQRSVLIIRGDGGIGDFILSLPSLRLLRQHYAASNVSLLVGSESTEFASNYTDFDEVISFE